MRTFRLTLPTAVVVSMVWIAVAWVAGCGPRSGPVLQGYWEGPFMPESGMDLTLVLHLDAGADSVQIGRVMLWDGEMHIQDDRLDRMEVGDGEVAFQIPAKETEFEGRLSDDGRRISGRFVFPDGSPHRVDVERIASPTHRATLPPSIAVPVAPVRQVSRAEAQEDLDMLMSVIVNNHPAPDRFLSRDSLRSLAEAVAADLPETLTVEDLLQRLHPLAAAVRCVHTDVRAPGLLAAAFDQEGGYLPAGLRVIDGRLFMTDSRSVPGLQAGQEIVSIDGRAVATVLNLMIAATSADGRGNAYPLYVINRDFARAHARAFGRRSSYDLVIEHRDGSTEHLEIPGRVPPDAEPPPATPPGLQFIDNGDIAQLRLNTFGPPNLPAAIDSLREAFARIRDVGSTGLIVDVRGNEGGHPLLAASLVSYLTDEPFNYFVGDPSGTGDLAVLFDPVPVAANRFTGPLVVLMDGGGISTTGHFLAILRFLGRGDLVGDESGSTYWSNDQSKAFVLPNSGLEINVPTRTFKTPSANLREDRGVEPDVRVNPGIDDVLAGRDLALELAVDRLRGME